MAEELEKTCENCEYEYEDMEGTHCRHCIHNAEEHFAPKINHDKKIRNDTLDEFCEKLSDAFCENSFTTTINGFENVDILTVDSLVEMVWEIAEQMKEVRND